MSSPPGVLSGRSGIRTWCPAALLSQRTRCPGLGRVLGSPSGRGEEAPAGTEPFSGSRLHPCPSAVFPGLLRSREPQRSLQQRKSTGELWAGDTGQKIPTMLLSNLLPFLPLLSGQMLLFPCRSGLGQQQRVQVGRALQEGGFHPTAPALGTWGSGVRAGGDLHQL